MSDHAFHKDGRTIFIIIYWTCYAKPYYRNRRVQKTLDICAIFDGKTKKKAFTNTAFRTSKMVRQKTNSSDSEIIAQFCLQNNSTLWYPKSRENKELHEINLRIDGLKAELNRLTNFLEKKTNS